ncbi:MAG: NADH-binding protein, partial [Actinobacteria bacterium]|nr:NADH-binding protein [Actinomycetota bacterium]
GGLGDDSPDLSAHLRSRLETGRRLAAGPVPVTTLRAAMVVGRSSAAFETIVALVDRLPAMVCPRWVSTETQPIALADVVRYLVGVGGRPEALGESFDVAGEDVMTYREMIERIGELRGRRPRIVEVPVLTPRLSSYWLHLVTPVKAGVARPLIEGLRSSTVAREHRIRELVPFSPTSFGDAARAALSA